MALITGGGGGGLAIPTDITVGTTRFHLDADGNLTITSTTATEPVIATEGSTGDTSFLGGDSGFGATGNTASVTRADLSGANTVALTARGVRCAVHAAPADVNIVAGDVYLWFDQTNGAGNTKLMVKGKSADGTVKTASIVLA